MTRMLASVNSLEEAQFVLNSAVDIIDLKQPEQGALGALPLNIVKSIVAEVNNRKAVSATIGDLPMHPEPIAQAVAAMAATGVDYVKIGFFPGGHWQNTISSLMPLARQGQQLIAVLFADTDPDFSIIKSLQLAGFRGVMLDTMDKTKGSLSDIMAKSKIENFVQIANKYQLLSGLAGSLKLDDISALQELDIDYLGFRGALCKNNNRTAQLNADALASILAQFTVYAD